MAVQFEHLQKPIHLLRKLLKHISEDPSMDEIHKLRTAVRRLEAIAMALRIEKEPHTQHLLKEMTPVRKAAGEVRDLDVLAAHAMTLAAEGESDSLVRLLEHLGAMRIDAAIDLHHTIADHRKATRHGLQRCSRLIADRFKIPQVDHGQDEKRTPADVTTAALEQTSVLSSWPRLSSANIHAFRIEVKKLGYMLELADDSDARFVEALEEAKDRSGEWHDWVKLVKIAKKVLDPEADGALIRRLRHIADEKLRTAIRTARSLRSQYLNAHGKMDEQPPRKQPQSVRLKDLVLKRNAELAGSAV